MATKLNVMDSIMRLGVEMCVHLSPSKKHNEHVHKCNYHLSCSWLLCGLHKFWLFHHDYYIVEFQQTPDCEHFLVAYPLFSTLASHIGWNEQANAKQKVLIIYTNQVSFCTIITWMDKASINRLKAVSWEWLFDHDPSSSGRNASGVLHCFQTVKARV